MRTLLWASVMGMVLNPAAGLAQRVIYKDVPPSPAQKAIISVSQWGVMHGFPNGTFRPSAPLSRAQGAYLVQSIYGFPPSSEGPTAFNDVQASDWFAGAVGSLLKVGVITTDASSFNPQEKLTSSLFETWLSRAAASAGDQGAPAGGGALDLAMQPSGSPATAQGLQESGQGAFLSRAQAATIVYQDMSSSAGPSLDPGLAKSLLKTFEPMFFKVLLNRASTSSLLPYTTNREALGQTGVAQAADEFQNAYPAAVSVSLSGLTATPVVSFGDVAQYTVRGSLSVEGGPQTQKASLLQDVYFIRQGGQWKVSNVVEHFTGS